MIAKWHPVILLSAQNPHPVNQFGTIKLAGIMISIALVDRIVDSIQPGVGTGRRMDREKPGGRKARKK